MSSEKPLRIALMASGNGSNAVNLIEWAREHKEVEVVAVVSDQGSAPVLARAAELGVANFCIEKGGRSKFEHEQALLDVLQPLRPDWICLCGYMRLLGVRFLSEFKWPGTKLYRVINIHPSLLPAFPGKKAYEDAFSYGVKLSGASVHLVDEGMDTGPVIAQRSFERKDDDEIEDFKRRGLAVEHQLYRDVMDLVRQGRLQLEKKGSSWYVCTDQTN